LLNGPDFFQGLPDNIQEFTDPVMGYDLQNLSPNPGSFGFQINGAGKASGPIAPPNPVVQAGDFNPHFPLPLKVSVGTYNFTLTVSGTETCQSDPTKKLTGTASKSMQFKVLKGPATANMTGQECSTWNIGFDAEGVSQIVPRGTFSVLCDTDSRMPVLSEDEICGLLEPYIADIKGDIVLKLSSYLDLLVRWNARTNLTAVRDEREIVRRHFGESLFAAEHLGDPRPRTLLDLGSGAGFPGLPIALCRPDIAVTLAESQGKKASFLREAVRTTGAANVEVWAARAENLPEGRTFDVVTLRAVDNMEAALAATAPRAVNRIVLLTGEIPEMPQGFSVEAEVRIPGSSLTSVVRAHRVAL
jgi:16S rRNA (guanine527-N7)-methyltransferase